MARRRGDDGRFLTEEDREAVRLQVLVRRNRAAARRRALINELKNVPCADCGQRFPVVCMDFDHVRGTKVKAVGVLALAVSLERILAEIAKCEVVCSNCHRIRTASRLIERAA